MERIRIDLTKYLENTALIYYNRDKKESVFKYKDLLKQIVKVGLVLENENLSKFESTTIGILCHKSPASIALLFTILENNSAFCFLTKDDVPDQLESLSVKLFFSDEILETNELLILRNSLDVFGRKIYLYKSTCTAEVRLYTDMGDSMNRVCYTVTTSGTTGQRKIVRVTYNCITSNVVALQNIFQLEEDVIYSSAPVVFDVFILDVFLALHSGSALMIMDENLRYSDESLNFMFSLKATGVTFLQITPSLFQHYGIENIQNIIMHPDSKLKFLVLGGEQFPPTKEVLTWQNWDISSRVRVFNIYGTTEVSCWAMIHEVTKTDLEAGEVPLGESLQDTSNAFLPDLKNISNLEELILTSQSRICFVDDKNWDQVLGQGYHFAQPTGDLVRRSDGKIFFYGRKNQIIKKFGERVNLNNIEIVATEVVSAVSCIYMKKKIVLFIKTDDESKIAVLKNHLNLKLKSCEVPDEIRRISFFPLCENGKISKQQLKEIYKDLLKEDREKRIEAEEYFLEAINQILNLRLSNNSPSSSSDEPDGKRMRTEVDSTFRALGGTSFDALRISMKLEDQSGLSNGLLPKLLGDRHSIRDICNYLKNLTPNIGQNHENACANKSTISLKIVQRFNLEKCVDSSPALVQIRGKPFISVGSHSHRVITIDPKSFKVISQTELGDRIENEVSMLDQEGLLGCYDGNLHGLDLETGAIMWKFDSKAMIKSKALVVGDLVIFGNYNCEKNLWCLQKDATGSVELKWNKLIGSRGILSAPLLINDSSILICTLEGNCELINADDGATIWSRKLNSPIFSSPRKIPGRDEILVAEVSNFVHCLDFNGNILWSFETEGHIFSSFLFHGQTSSDIKIIFGCHDKKLRCLNYNYERQSAALEWSAELQSQIYGSPLLAAINSTNFVVSCATNGSINFVKLSDGSIEHTQKLPGEIFSTPVIYDRTLFVGCRDNFVYCLRF